MWFCHKCNKWYDDSVTILKHFQNSHTAAASPLVKDEPMSCKSECEANRSNTKMHILKPTITKLVVKKKKNAQFSNGVLQSPPKTEGASVKIISKSSKSKDVLKTQMKNTAVTPNQVPSKHIGLVQISDRKDTSAIDQVMIVGKLNEDGVLNKIRTYICKFCCRRFPNGDLLQTHLKTHQENPKHACHLCGLTAGTFSALMAHYVKHSGLKTFTISKRPNESKIYFREPESKKESNEKHTSSIFCNQCKRHFNSKKVFSTHYCPPLNSKTEYVCAYCREVTTSVEEYRDHIQSHSPSSQFACKHCSNKFGQKIQLQQHMKFCLKKASKSTLPNRKRTAKGTFEKQNKPRKIAPKVNETKELTATVGTKMKNYSDSSLGKPKTGCKANLSNSSPLSNSCTNLEETKITSTLNIPIKVDNKASSAKNSELCTESDDNIHLRLRPKKAKVIYTSDSSPDDNINLMQPTRRSARLVNRKHIRFSRTSSDSETADTDRKYVNEHSISPSRIIPVSPVNVSSNFKNSVLSSPRKDEPNKMKIPISPKNKSKNQKSHVSVSPKKGNSSRLKNTAAVSPKKTIQIKRKKQAVKGGGNIETKSNTLFCNLCSLIFRSKGSLKRHKKMHSGKPQFVCQFCGKFFYRRDIHRRHESNVHQNALSQPYACYYCKHTFDTSVQLKEHAFDAHSGRASAPERIRRCTPSNKVLERDVHLEENFESHPISTNSVIKKELDDTEKEKSNSESKNSYTYNCGMCDISFDSPPNLVKHFEEVHGVINNLNIVQVQKQDKRENSERLLSEIGIPFVRDKTDKSHNHCLQSPPSHQKNLSQCTKLNSNSSTSALISCDSVVHDKDMSTADMSGNFSWKNTDYSCSLCFMVLPEKGTMMCTEPEVHKAVDWYQCLLCSVVGPQHQVQEHMLQHMSKIGTFIVNVNDKNFEGISDYTRYLSQKNQGIEKANCTVQDDQPFDHVHSIFTLMEEVTCVRCSEVIVDLNLLLSHPCMKAQTGLYLCFVKDCNFSSNIQTEVQNHLKQFHYHALYSDSRSLQSISTSDSMRECNSSADIDFGSSGIEHNPFH